MIGGIVLIVLGLGCGASAFLVPALSKYKVVMIILALIFILAGGLVIYTTSMATQKADRLRAESELERTKQQSDPSLFQKNLQTKREEYAACMQPCLKMSSAFQPKAKNACIATCEKIML
jgi:hypothetical protein